MPKIGESRVDERGAEFAFFEVAAIPLALVACSILPFGEALSKARPPAPPKDRMSAVLDWPTDSRCWESLDIVIANGVTWFWATISRSYVFRSDSVVILPVASSGELRGSSAAGCRFHAPALIGSVAPLIIRLVDPSDPERANVSKPVSVFAAILP